MCSLGSPLRLGTRREWGRGGANPGGMERGSGLGWGRLLAGWGRASQLCSLRWPLRLGTPIS